MKNQKFLWAAAHKPTQEQVKFLKGEIIFLENKSPRLYSKLTNLKYKDDYVVLANDLLNLCLGNDYILVQPAGNPVFQNVLGRQEYQLEEQSRFKFKVEIWYAFSERMSKDIPQEDGTVRKVSIFKHLGWDKI